MSREQHHSCLCFHACACCTKWEGRRLPWSNHSDFWPANAVHPLLPSHPHSLLPSPKSQVLTLSARVCTPQSVTANLLLSCLSHKHVLQPLTPQPTSFLLRAPPAVEFSLCLHVLHLCLRPRFPGNLQYLSHQHGLLQLLPVSCCSYLLSILHHTQSSRLISVPYQQNLSSCKQKEIQVQVAFTKKSTWMRHLRKKKACSEGKLTDVSWPY